MCIPLELDVPVTARDGQVIGTACEILCSCPADGDAHGSPFTADGADLWLRVARPSRRDLYIPFGEIADAWAGGVRLRLDAGAVDRGGWDVVPPGLPIPARRERVGAA